MDLIENIFANLLFGALGAFCRMIYINLRTGGKKPVTFAQVYHGNKSRGEKKESDYENYSNGFANNAVGVIVFMVIVFVVFKSGVLD